MTTDTEVIPAPSTPMTRCSNCFSVEAWASKEGKFTCALPHPPVSLARKVGAEFIGTLILIFAGTATPIVNQKTHGSETLLGLAASSGLAVMIVIFSTGHISGAHLNPSITVAFAALGHFLWKHTGELAGIAIGATVMLNILIAGEMTGASMNPVRTLGPAIAAKNYKALWVYLTAPFLGALTGAGVYSAVKLPEKDDKPSVAQSIPR